MRPYATSLYLIGLTLVSNATAADGPIAEEISKCFSEAYVAAAQTRPFTSPKYEVECKPATPFRGAEGKVRIFEYAPPRNYVAVADGLQVIDLSNNSGSTSQPELTLKGGVRVILTCQGGGIGGGRGWMRVKIEGKERYVPPRAEEERMIRTCKRNVLGGS